MLRELRVMEEQGKDRRHQFRERGSMGRTGSIDREEETERERLTHEQGEDWLHQRKEESAAREREREEERD